MTSVLRTAKLDAKGKTTKTAVNDGSATTSTGTLPTTATTPVTSASTGTDAAPTSTTSAVPDKPAPSDGSLRQGYTRKGVLHGKHGATDSKQVNPYLGLSDAADILPSQVSTSNDLSEQPRKRIAPGMGLPGGGDPKLPLPPHKHLPIDSERRNYKAPQIHEEHSFSGKKRSSRYVDQEGNQVEGGKQMKKEMNFAKKEESFGLSDPSSLPPRGKRSSSSRTGSAKGRGGGDALENGSGDGDKPTKASQDSGEATSKKKVSIARPDYIKLGGVDGLPVQYLRVTPKKKKGSEEGAAGGSTPSDGRRRLEEESTTAPAATATTAGESNTATTTTAVAAATPANVESSSSSSSTTPSATSNDLANANSGMIVDPVPIPPADQSTTSSANNNNGPNQKRRQPGGNLSTHSNNTRYQHTLLKHAVNTHSTNPLDQHAL